MLAAVVGDDCCVRSGWLWVVGLLVLSACAGQVAVVPVGGESVPTSVWATTGPATTVPSTVSIAEIDVDGCPPGWRDNDGFDATEIVIASHGGFGASGHADGLEAYLDIVNSRGGALGRELRLESVNLAPGDAVQYRSSMAQRPEP